MIISWRGVCCLGHPAVFRTVLTDSMAAPFIEAFFRPVSSSFSVLYFYCFCRSAECKGKNTEQFAIYSAVDHILSELCPLSLVVPHSGSENSEFHWVRQRQQFSIYSWSEFRFLFFPAELSVCLPLPMERIRTMARLTEQSRLTIYWWDGACIKSLIQFYLWRLSLCSLPLWVWWPPLSDPGYVDVLLRAHLTACGRR